MLTYKGGAWKNATPDTSYVDAQDTSLSNRIAAEEITRGQNDEYLQGQIDGKADSIHGHVPTHIAGLLGGDGKISLNYVPQTAITNVYVAASQEQQNNLTVQTGDVVIRTDENRNYIYDGASWQQLLVPPDLVQSVNGYIGAVNLTFSDVGAEQAGAVSSLETSVYQTISGVQNSLQTAIDAKAPIDSPTFTGTINLNTTSANAFNYVKVAGSNYAGFNLAEGWIVGNASNNSNPILFIKGTGTADLVNVFDGSTEVFTIIDGGKVGINSNAPAYRLDVSGTTSTDGIRTDVGLELKQVAKPVGGGLALAAGGNVDVGQHYYHITYITALGETEPLMLSPITTDASNKTVVITVPTSPDTRVTGRKIYRTKAGQAQYQEYLLTTIANNTTTTYTDTAADSTLAGFAGVAYFRANTTNKQITLNGNRAVFISEHLTATGVNAGAAITTGGRNSFFGNASGQNVSSGTGNNFFGYACGLNTTSGGSNVAMGYSAMYFNTTGGGNTALGHDASFYNVTGNNNVAVGAFALFGTSTQSCLGSVAVGYNALFTAGTNANYNVAIGYEAGKQVTSGATNTLIGHQAGDNITTGGSNIIIGQGIDAPSATTSQQLSIGNLIYGTGLDGTATTVSTGKVGIGVAAPTSKLDIAGDVEITSTSYYYLGDPTTDGTIRMGQGTGANAGKLVAQKRASGAWGVETVVAF